MIGGAGGAAKIDLTQLFITYLQVSAVVLPTFGQDCLKLITFYLLLKLHFILIDTFLLFLHVGIYVKKYLTTFTVKLVFHFFDILL